MRFNKPAAAVAAAALSSLLSSGLLGTASAQLDECVASTEDGFDYQVSGNGAAAPTLVGTPRTAPILLFPNNVQVHHQLGAGEL